MTTYIKKKNGTSLVPVAVIGSVGDVVTTSTHQTITEGKIYSGSNNYPAIQVGITSSHNVYDRIIVNGGVAAATTLTPSISSWGNIHIGASTNSAMATYAIQRLCDSDGKTANQMKMAINADGTAKISHLRGPDASGIQDSYLLMDSAGFKVSYSGQKGVSTTSEYTLIDTNNGDKLISDMGFVKGNSGDSELAKLDTLLKAMVAELEEETA